MKRQLLFVHGGGEGAYEEDRKLAASLREGPGSDDEWVPFAHLALYAEKVPQARVREFEGRGHQFDDDLSEVAHDVEGLERSGP
jgi:hypothetical protein